MGGKQQQYVTCHQTCKMRNMEHNVRYVNCQPTMTHYPPEESMVTIEGNEPGWKKSRVRMGGKMVAICHMSSDLRNVNCGTQCRVYQLLTTMTHYPPEESMVTIEANKPAWKKLRVKMGGKQQQKNGGNMSHVVSPVDFLPNVCESERREDCGINGRWCVQARWQAAPDPPQF